MQNNEISLYFNDLAFSFGVFLQSKYLIFCCFTGLAFIDVQQLSPEHIFIDVQQLSPEHIVKDNNGNLWIRKPRQKTKNMCNIPLLDIPLKILRKYADYPTYILLPVPCNQKMNSYLKEIADLCQIKKNLTTHCPSLVCYICLFG